MFLIPIIKVKNRGEKSEGHIVGTSPHDMLYIDKETGGIHYHNIQCCESTQKIWDDNNNPEYAYEFSGTEGHFYEAEIEFLTPDQLFEFIIATEQLQTDDKIRLIELHNKYFEQFDKHRKDISKAEEKYGIKTLW